MSSSGLNGPHPHPLPEGEGGHRPLPPGDVDRGGEPTCSPRAATLGRPYGGGEGEGTPLLTVIIPCYDERETILTVFERVRALDIDKEIVVVDNCSTDGTRELVAGLQGQERVRVVLQPRNMGKGTSVRTGIAAATGEFVVCQDADLEYDPSDILRLLEHARTGADAVFGTRLSDATTREGGSRLFSRGRRLVTSWFNLLFGTRLTDVSTCYKLLRRSVIQGIALRSRGFDLDFEIPAKLALRGVRIHEVPISYSPRGFAEGKKINWRDGVRAFWTILKHRVALLPARGAAPTSPPVPRSARDHPLSASGEGDRPKAGG